MRIDFKKTVAAFFMLTLSLALIIFGQRFLGEEAKKHDDFYRLENTAVTVTAKITDMDANYSTEGSPDYDAYVSYEYNGVQYENIKYRTFSNDKDYGKEIQIEIDPQNPATIRPHTPGKAVLIICCIMIVMGAISTHTFTTMFLTSNIAPKRWQKIYTTPQLDLSVVKAEIKYENRCKMLFSTGVGIIIAVLILFLAERNYAETGSFTATKVYALTLLIYLAFNCYYYLHSIISTQGIIIVPDTLNRIKKESDTDGNQKDVWEFTHCRRWTPKAKDCVLYCEITLNTIRVGTDVYLALNKQGKIRRIFKAEDFTL